MQGYRDVNVKFRILRSPWPSISDEDWRQLGLLWHVCELQLLPVQFFHLKFRQSHTNYIRYRNLKSE